MPEPGPIAAIPSALMAQAARGYAGKVALRLLKRHGLMPDRLDLIAINGAFVATVLVNSLRLAGKDHLPAEKLRARINAHGGAAAIGHPFGASGARIYRLRRLGGGIGVAAICGGFGRGDGVLIEGRD